MASTNEQTPALDPAVNGIWQKLARETDSAYAPFLVYLELGADATLQQVAAKTGRSPDAIRQLSSLYYWMERAAAWRRHLHEKDLVAIAGQSTLNRKLSQMRQQILQQKDWERAQKLGLVCDQALDQLLATPLTKVAYYQLPPLLRAVSQAGQNAVAIDYKAVEPPDPENDPSMQEFNANLAKASEDFARRKAEQAAQCVPPTLEPAPETPLPTP